MKLHMHEDHAHQYARMALEPMPYFCLRPGAHHVLSLAANISSLAMLAVLVYQLCLSHLPWMSLATSTSHSPPTPSLESRSSIPRAVQKSRSTSAAWQHKPQPDFLFQRVVQPPVILSSICASPTSPLTGTDISMVLALNMDDDIARMMADLGNATRDLISTSDEPDRVISQLQAARIANAAAQNQAQRQAGNDVLISAWNGINHSLHWVVLH